AGRQVERESAKAIRAMRTASVRSAAAACPTLRRRAFEPAATAPQKKSVALVPNAPPMGTPILRSRQSSDHWIGAVHWDFRFGPVGPLKIAFWSSPQRPSKAIHGKAVRASSGSLGI